MGPSLGGKRVNMDPITLVSAVATVAGAAYKAYTYFTSAKKEEDENDASSDSSVDGLEVRGIRRTQLDHLSIGQLKGRLEVSQVGEVGVTFRPKVRRRRARTLNALACWPLTRRGRGRKR